MVLRSLLNLTADLRARRTAGASGVQLEGTAADLHFNRWQLDWARQASPDVWSPVLPPAINPVVDDRFTTWVPPEPGSFLVRLTAEDRAGNRRDAVKRVYSAETPSITDLYLAPRYFSPNGDGVFDRAVAHYRVLQPVHLEFHFFAADGTPVRTLARDHGTADGEHEVEWDGRDDHGLPVPDGEYRMRVQGYEFFVTVDTRPPQVILDLSAADGCEGGLRTVDPRLEARVSEEHFDSFVAEWGEGAEPRSGASRSSSSTRARKGSTRRGASWASGTSAGASACGPPTWPATRRWRPLRWPPKRWSSPISDAIGSTRPPVSWRPSNR